MTLACLILFGGSCLGAADLFAPPKDLMDDVPADFPRFHFAGHEEDAQILGRYLWYHFSKRGGESPVLFNKEYNTTADMWVGGALHPGWPKNIQEIHRDNLLAIRMNPDGYVWTHQHFSHAHEQGWPFPMWTQNPTGPEGYAAGWHFQEDGSGWVWDTLRQFPDSPFCRAKSIEGWTLDSLKSDGIIEKRWHLQSTGASPALTTPGGVQIVAYNAPFLQLRWIRSGEPKPGNLPFVEWMREGDTGFSPDRRVYFSQDSGNPDYESASGVKHSMITMYTHPGWTGKIKSLRLSLAPGEADVKFELDSFFTAYDTRHTINNPIYIMACWEYFRWTGDIPFLKKVINPMRTALRFQQTELGGLEHNHIRHAWVGHEGRSGLRIGPDGKKEIIYGCGVGGNYWDILPIGGDDMYATAQYYAATRVMAEVERVLQRNPGWGVPAGALAFDPDTLEKHADAVKTEANRLFWNEPKGRFVACIDADGQPHDYGFTFVNLDAVWYGIASDEHARAILDWLDGTRIVEGDTSQGADIYHWRFGPRATTLRNIDWYHWGWTAPESIPFGGQVQDGGAVLGFSFYDLWARLHFRDADNAWQRLGELLAWEKDVWANGGYRAYYADGKHGTTLQGGGTAGGLGIDCEFYESSLVPSIVARGFLGMKATGDGLAFAPRLPAACPEMGISNALFRGVRFDVKANGVSVFLNIKDGVESPIRFTCGDKTLVVSEPGQYQIER